MPARVLRAFLTTDLGAAHVSYGGSAIRAGVGPGHGGPAPFAMTAPVCRRQAAYLRTAPDCWDHSAYQASNSFSWASA